MNLHHFSIRRRLGMAFGLLTLFVVGMVAIGTWQLQSVARETANVMALPLAKERTLSDWYRNIYSNVRRHTVVALSRDESLAPRLAGENTEFSRVSSQQQQQLAQLISGPQEQALFDDVGVQRKRFLAARDAIYKAKAEGREQDVQRMLASELTPDGDRYLAALQTLLDFQRRQINAAAQSVQDNYESGRNALIALGVLATAAAVAL
ncbi:MCP four helix bundle domain-containing protein, partial [Paracidovorax wautersii]|uniref:MCP four helix bundle domain-containing protein n=1 Tax=Paracidovorax wautersii TaxID=1177982 RepID=UPI0031DB0E7E